MKIKEILFWIFIILGVSLLIWNVFGNSPTEFITLITLIFAMLLKMWTISDRQLKTEMRFNNLAKDFKKHIN